MDFLRLLVQFGIVTVLLSLTQAAEPQRQPDCPDEYSCGNVYIPYPFDKRAVA
ncbi:conserved hypothetical protein [Ricinus communis]|uniref:Uncharacterized protein n=1 Tax=Ricinus communis TaxID=3988 RepID=B9S2Q9_RICCO|nr:conserved hypothetical protein [Ricinus communis]